MQTPYEILDVDVTDNDAIIKQAYLKQVKINPPDRDQQQFQVIHAAYTAIKDHKSRVSYDLFNLPVANFNNVLDKALHAENDIALDAEVLLDMLTTSIDDTSLLSTLGKPGK